MSEELVEIECDECGGEGFCQWSDDMVEWETEECESCKGSGILRVPV